MSRALDWNREGRIWPHRETSDFIKIAGTTWHVQQMGKAGAPQALLLHGTGASVHSWRSLMPMLAQDFAVTSLDLPRHAFTRGHPPDAMSLPRMAAEIARLNDVLGLEPDLVIGHSAGAALALQLALDHGYGGPIVGLNSALRPFPGPAAQIFPAVAKLLFVNPLVPRLFSKMTTFGKEAERFLFRSTGSRIDAEGMACYEALFANPHHTKGGLAMMANWDLPSLKTRMHEITNPVMMVHSDRDAAIPLDWAREAHACLPNAALEVLEGLGHLAHEEAPERSHAAIIRFAQAQTILAAA
ncbi:MAG: alpha/beta fold hydrolase [Erythrobacter sp.]|uniref:alpha/beta fold hydrolase BchO n=1 Tax=Erythrobacter sp. TaxID=1042 RepID=UPI00262822A6|nr:alpha/beta fold hydrolase BchO [Erythrobacter sp.]MDJ0978585.1 alpha/beta fold hydrolase [Erythrobacter sp.]